MPSEPTASAASSAAFDILCEPSELSTRNTDDVAKRQDGLIDWIKGMLMHSFVLGNQTESYVTTMKYIETLIKEHRIKGNSSRLKTLVPTVDMFHTELHLVEAFNMYNAKYSVTSRKHVPPTFHEIRHILNLSQLLAINVHLKMVSFDGDQTLYSDGGNFEEKSGLSYQIIELIRAGINVVVITAANYEHNGSMYELRLQGLLRRFAKARLSPAEIARFHVMGGECHYLLRAQLTPGDTIAHLIAVAHEVWQSGEGGKNCPMSWPISARESFLDVAEASFRASQSELKIRARILRKKTSVGMIPGGEAMVKVFPGGHGKDKIKSEILDEVALRAIEDIAKIKSDLIFPYCVFNGGRDCWVDVGTKGVAAKCLQSYFHVTPGECIHIGDQFLAIGNDISTRAVCATVWIETPKETYKILDHVLRFSLGKDKMERAAAAAAADDLDRVTQPANGGVPSLSLDVPEVPAVRPKVMNVYTGEMMSAPATPK